LDAEDPILRAVRVLDDAPDALLAVVGPTASGKTDFAMRIAERANGEIISADSVQIYRGFDIGSGKPTLAERARVPHHVIDVAGPLDPIDAARFGDIARAAIDDVRARGKRPILCGGTYLWVKALLFGLADAPPASEEHRARHRALVEAEGRPALHAKLALVDPTIATRLHPNDFVRVSRALEVHELTGEPMSAWQARHGFATPRVDARLVGLTVDPEELTRRIVARVHGFMEAGWVDEVRALTAAGYENARAMGSVGYREIRAHLAKPEAERGDRSDLEAEIVRATRVFARRQRTWLHHSNVTWL
jgi:tRNA dimethylallyltransferase